LCNEKITTCNGRNGFDESWYGETHLVKCIIMRLKMKVKVSYRSEVRVLGDEWMNLEMERTMRCLHSTATLHIESVSMWVSEGGTYEGNSNREGKWHDIDFLTAP
jgi:hypothetical protein